MLHPDQPIQGFKKLKKKKRTILSKSNRKTSDSGGPTPRYDRQLTHEDYIENQKQSIPQQLHPGEKEYPSKFAKVWREYLYKKQQENPNLNKPEEKNTPDPAPCCCLGWCWCQFNHLFNTGQKKSRMTEEDLGPIPPHLKVNKVRDRALAMIDEYNFKNSKKLEDIYPILKRLFNPFMKKAIIYKILETGITIMMGFIPKHFLPEVKDSSQERNEYILFLCPVLAIFMTIIKTLISHQSATFAGASGGISIVCLRGLLYDKLRRSNESFLRVADSSLITKMNVFDFATISGYIAHLPAYYCFPITFLFSVSAMIYFVSLTTMSALFIFLIAWIFLIILIKKMAYHNLRQQYCVAKRGLKVGETLSKLKTIKYDSTKSYTEKMIMNLRGEENFSTSTSNYLKGLINFFMNLTPLMSIVFILMLEDKIMKVHLTVVETFTIVSVISSIGKPLKAFVFILVSGSQFNMAKQTFNKMYFTVSEKDNQVIEDTYLKNGSVIFDNVSAESESDHAIDKVITAIFGESFGQEMKRKGSMAKKKNNLSHEKTVQENGIAGKGEKSIKSHTVRELRDILERSKQTVIKDVNLKINGGQKIALLGDTDSSLSSFILTMVGDTGIMRGVVRHKGKIVYLDASHSPFLAGKSIRENILMEDVYISTRYKRIVKKVGLNFKKFKGEDKCEVLEGGINFSNAERRKILLCRMLYVSGEIYIIKDIFGYEEVEVELRMYQNIVQDILGTKTVMITTKNEELLEKVDKIISFDKFKVHDMGNFKSFMKAQHALQEVAQDLAEIVTPERNLQASNLSERANLITPRRITEKYQIKGSELERKAEALKKDPHAFLNQFNQKYIDNSGKVSKTLDERDVYEDLFGRVFQYMFLRGKGRIVFLFILFVIGMLLTVSVDVWTGIWSNKAIKGFTVEQYIMIYLQLSLMSSFWIILRDRCFSKIMMTNANQLHDSMVNSMLNIDFRWAIEYKTGALGFKQGFDQKHVDGPINHAIHDLMDGASFVLGGMIILNYVYMGTMLLATILIFILFSMFMKKYIKTTKEIIRMVATKVAALGGSLGASITHMNNYRALHKVEILDKKFQIAADEALRVAGHLGHKSQRWLGMRVMIIEILFIAVAYCIPIVIVEYLKGSFHRTTVEFAFAITWSLKIIGYFNKVIHNIINLMINIVSFGRIDNFLHKVKMEDHRNAKTAFDAQAPHRFAIEMENVTLYMCERPVVKDVSINIVKKSRTALVGNSGSGKHLLFDLIMKIYDRDKEEGNSNIHLLGKSIDDIDADQIRKKVAFLDKDAITLSGTVRDNVDPTSKFTDEEIIRIMSYLKADEILSNKKGGIAVKKSSSGANSRNNSMNRSRDGPEVLDTSRPLVTNISTDMDIPQTGYKNTSLIRQFLERKISGKVGDQPPRIRKLIKMTKAVLEKPPILLVDQIALDFSNEELPDMMVKLNALFPNSTILMTLATFEDILEFENCIVLEGGFILEHDKVENLILNKASNLNHLIINSDPQDFIDLYAKAGGKEPEPTNMEKLYQEEEALIKEEERLLKEEAEIQKYEKELIDREAELEALRELKEKQMEAERVLKAKQLDECFQNSKTDLPTLQGYEYTQMDLGRKVQQIERNTQAKETIARSERSCSRPNSNFTSRKNNQFTAKIDSAANSNKKPTSAKNHLPFIPRPESSRGNTPTNKEKDPISWNITPRNSNLSQLNQEELKMREEH